MKNENCFMHRLVTLILDDLLEERETISEQEIDAFSSIAVEARNILFTLRTPDKEDLGKMLRDNLPANVGEIGNGYDMKTSNKQEDFVVFLETVLSSYS